MDPVIVTYNSDFEKSHRYCEFLNRISRMHIFNYASENAVVDAFWRIKNVDDLHKLCSRISNFLISTLGYNSLFIP